jgi:hypothetical protein
MTITGFNGSIWNALWVALPIALIVFGVTFCTVKKGWFYFFDPKHNKDPRLKDAGEFGPHMQRYQDLSKLVIALSAGAIAFLINTLVGEKSPVSEFAQKLAECAPIVVGYFGIAIAFLVAFMVCQNVWYEEYSHSAEHNTYKAWKYAISMSLGYAGLISFVLGFGWLAANAFHK